MDERRACKPDESNKATGKGRGEDYRRLACSKRIPLQVGVWEKGEAKHIHAEPQDGKGDQWTLTKGNVGGGREEKAGRMRAEPGRARLLRFFSGASTPGIVSNHGGV